MIVLPGEVEMNFPTIFLRERTAVGIWSSFHGSGKFFERAEMYWSLGGSKGTLWIMKFFGFVVSLGKSKCSHPFGLRRMLVFWGSDL